MLGGGRVEVLAGFKTHEREFRSVTMLGNQLPKNGLILSAAALLNRYTRHKAILLVDRPIGGLGV